MILILLGISLLLLSVTALFCYRQGWWSSVRRVYHNTFLAIGGGLLIACYLQGSLFFTSRIELEQYRHFKRNHDYLYHKVDEGRKAILLEDHIKWRDKIIEYQERNVWYRSGAFIPDKWDTYFKEKEE